MCFIIKLLLTDPTSNWMQKLDKCEILNHLFTNCWSIIEDNQIKKIKFVQCKGQTSSSQPIPPSHSILQFCPGLWKPLSSWNFSPWGVEWSISWQIRWKKESKSLAFCPNLAENTFTVRRCASISSNSFFSSKVLMLTNSFLVGSWNQHYFI